MKTKKTKITLLIIFLFLLNTVVISFFFLNHPKGQTYTLNLTKNGFEPQSLTIQKGDTIIFSTTTGKQFWPASNLHPTHAIYPAFDPKMPIAPDKTWSFTFDKAGSWQFHDHLAPIFKGQITVITNDKN